MTCRLVAPSEDVQACRLNSSDEGAQITGVNPRTARRYISNGLLPAHRVSTWLIKIHFDQSERPIRHILAAREVHQ